MTCRTDWEKEIYVRKFCGQARSAELFYSLLVYESEVCVLSKFVLSKTDFCSHILEQLVEAMR
jgi:hypothetical protein